MFGSDESNITICREKKMMVRYHAIAKTEIRDRIYYNIQRDNGNKMYPYNLLGG